MPDRLYHVLDTLLTFGTVVIASSASVLLTNTEAPTSNTIELQILLLPLIGSGFACGTLIMLNPQPETRRIVIGRACAALLFGISLPQVIGMFHPALQNLSVKPFALILMGAIISALAFVLSKPFTREMYARADSIAKREAQRLEKRYSADEEEELGNED